MPYTPLLMHPIAFVFVQKLILGVLLGFTEAGSTVRAAIFPILIFYNYSLVPAYGQRIPSAAWIGLAAGQNLGGLLEFLEKLFISQWSFEYGGPKKAAQIGKTIKPPKDTKREGRSGSLDTFWSRLKFGAWAALSSRHIGTSYQARNTPFYSSSDSSYIPTMTKFLLSRASIFIACYLIMDLLLLGADPALNPILYSVEHVPFFPRLLKNEIDLTEFGTRVSSTLGFWVGTYLVIQGYLSALTFLDVACGFSEPKDERPIFGPLIDIYSIRKFWGTFWHQMLRKVLTIPSAYIATHFLSPLNLSQKFHDALFRYTELVLAFLISGIFHQAIDVAQGLSWAESGSIECFLLMAAGIMFEDTVIWMWSRGARQEAAGWQKTVGYIWVALYFSWVTPGWMYPTARRDGGGVYSSPIPFSLIGLFRK